MGCFGAVVETECAGAGFAAEREEVELPAVFKLAVPAYRLEIMVRQLAEGLVLLRIGCWHRYEL